MFTWKDGSGSDVAHQSPEVMAIWEPMTPILENMQISATVGATVHLGAHEGTGPQRVESQLFFMSRLADIIAAFKSRNLLDSTLIRMTRETNVRLTAPPTSPC
jgi:hypothetical protein